MNSNIITAISTGLLAIFGLIQLWIFFVQKRQNKLNLTEEYRKRWSNLKVCFGAVVFIGRDEEEFYQVADAKSIHRYKSLRKNDQFNGPTIWAEAARLEDLPPEDVISAADSKVKTGKENRKRLFKECIRLSKFRFLHAIRLSRFLKNSEYRKRFYGMGLSKLRLKTLKIDWTKRLLKYSE